ncbi:MAG: hypothetical protein FWC15_08320 [Fibromonadales bacterium]|nr:hypothetical protein [Fibromonadales bacterium]
MRKFLLITTIALAANAHSQNKGDIKLLESISNDDNVIMSFEYDDKNRIKKMVDYYGESQFTYILGNLTSLSAEDAGGYITADNYGNNTISVHNGMSCSNTSNHSIDLNKSGYIIKDSYYSYHCDDSFRQSIPSTVKTYQYKGDNTVKVKYDKRDIYMEYKYDNKKSPFFYNNTPKWFLQLYFANEDLGLNNNITEIIHKRGKDTLAVKKYTYKYDSDGFPTERTAIKKETSYSEYDTTVTIDTMTVTFKYRYAKNVSIEKETAPLLTYGRTANFSEDNTFHFPGFVKKRSQWGFGQYEEEFTASSSLSPNKNISYDAKNLQNDKKSGGGKRSTAWCEGEKGYGIGQRVNMSIKTSLLSAKAENTMRFKSLMFVNGYAKDETTWENNSRIKILRLYVDGKHWSNLLLSDSKEPQIFYLPENLRIYPKKSGKKVGDNYQTDLSFEIAEVYKGSKYDDVCLTGIAVDVDGGIDRSSQKGVMPARDGTITDPRDKQKYRTMKIGKLTWMAQNLNFKTKNSLCYENDDSNCEEYGRMYAWDAATAACPAGWWLPEDDDWKNLGMAVGGVRALNGGWHIDVEKLGKFIDDTEGWWSATEDWNNSVNYWQVVNEDFLGRVWAKNEDKAYVRCVK